MLGMIQWKMLSVYTIDRKVTLTNIQVLYIDQYSLKLWSFLTFVTMFRVHLQAIMTLLVIVMVVEGVKEIVTTY